MNIERHKIVAAWATAIAYLLWLLVYILCEYRWTVKPFEITTVSVLGTVIIAVYICIWWRMTGKVFTPLNIFLAFFTAFNFGQCLLWAVGIHTEDEIGSKLVYHTLAADNHVILQAQLIFIICFITLNCGAMLVWNHQQSVQLEPLRVTETETEPDARYRYLFYTALLLSLVVIPVSLYNAINKFRLAQAYGYNSLYYGTARESVSNPIITILSSLLFPCLLGLLIGSRYQKRVRVVAYSIFLVFAAVTLLSGDRGEWINLLVFLFWAEYHLYKKRSKKTLLTAGIIGILFLSIMNAIVSMRNIGLSWAGFVSAFTEADSNPLVSLLTEFGHSMGISILLLAYQTKCPYGNTFLMSIPTIFGTSLGNRLLGTNYVQLHTWFPEYLGISYGTDFSIIGEAMLNCGVYAAPLVLLFEGMIIAKVAQLPYRRNTSPLGLCLSISAMVYIIKIARSTLWLVLNGMIYTLIIFTVTYLFVKTLLGSKR